MRTIIHLPEDHLKPLAEFCRAEGISRAEAIRQAIAGLLARAGRKSRKSALDKSFGLWAGRGIGDGVEYQRRLRAEWDDHDRPVNARRGKVPKKRR